MKRLTERPIEAVILDVDGTLWDSTEIVAAAWTRAVQECGLPRLCITGEKLKSLFGKTMQVISDEMLPMLEPQERYRCMDLCCKYEHETLMADACHICYPGVTDTIRELSAFVRVCIVSNCQSGYIELFLDKTGLGPYITDIECYGNTRKKKGENIRMLMERNSIEQAVYVGDTQGDCDAAHEAGIPFIHAEYGFGRPDGAEAKITRFDELLKLVGTGREK